MRQFICSLLLAAIIFSPITANAAVTCTLTINNTVYQISESVYDKLAMAVSNEEKIAIFEELGIEVGDSFSYQIRKVTTSNPDTQWDMLDSSPGRTDGFTVESGKMSDYSGGGSVVTIPADITSIANYAFYENRSRLKIVNIPDTVTSIGSKAFYGCTKLIHIVCSKKSAAYQFAKKNDIPVTTTTTIKAEKKTILLTKGQTVKPLVFNVTSSVKWKSSNKKIVKCIGSGKIKGCKVGNTKVSATVKGKTLRISVKVKAKNEKNRISQAIRESVKSSMTTKEKIKAIHNWMIANVRYDYKNYLRGSVPAISHTSKGARVRGVAVCDGYAYAFKRIMSRLGIPCKMVYGSSDGVLHAWNKVQVNGKWRYVDVTFDDPIINGSSANKTPYYTYFLKTKKQMRKSHSFA